MVVEDTAHITLRRIPWSEEDGLTEGNHKDGDGDSEPEPREAAESVVALLHTRSLPRKRLFGVKDSFEEDDADSCEDDVITGQLFDPCRDLDSVQICCEDSRGGLNHREQRGQGDGEE